MRIGITQRVEVIPSYGERRDCLDQQWFRFLESLGFTPVPVPNQLYDVKQWALDLGLEGLVLSGGNDLAHLPDASNAAVERDRTEAQLLAWAQEHAVPVIGVCRGLQMMYVWLGGRLEPVSGHVAVRHSLLPAVQATDVFARFTEVNSFHNWGITQSGVPASVIPQCLSPEGDIEAFRHASLPWAGIMWHPEREVPFSESDKLLFNHILKGEPCKH